jgi:hypothetical protein
MEQQVILILNVDSKMVEENMRGIMEIMVRVHAILCAFIEL